MVTVNSLPSTGDGTFSNDKGESIRIKRVVQYANEKDPKNIELYFYKEDSAHDSMQLVVTRSDDDTGALKAGTYTTIYTLQTMELGVKYSYSVAGTITVTKNADQYSVTLDLNDNEYGVKITGNYSGKINIR